jgi:hypothetical protein
MFGSARLLARISPRKSKERDSRDVHSKQKTAVTMPPASTNRVSMVIPTAVEFDGDGNTTLHFDRQTHVKKRTAGADTKLLSSCHVISAAASDATSSGSVDLISTSSRSLASHQTSIQEPLSDHLSVGASSMTVIVDVRDFPSNFPNVVTPTSCYNFDYGHEKFIVYNEESMSEALGIVPSPFDMVETEQDDESLDSQRLRLGIQRSTFQAEFFNEQGTASLSQPYIAQDTKSDNRGVEFECQQKIHLVPHDDENEIVFEISSSKENTETVFSENSRSSSPLFGGDAWEYSSGNKDSLVQNTSRPIVTAPHSPSIQLRGISREPFLSLMSDSKYNAVSPDSRKLTPAKMIHRPTASGLLSKRSLSLQEPVDGLRFSLTEGAKETSLANVEATRCGLDDEEQCKVKESHVLWTIAPAAPPRRESKNSCKIFLLLLQPASKIFELIQLMYPPSTTTIGGILDLIPCNATEPSLGSQKYQGLTRPKRNGDEFRDLSMLASSAENSAGISRGEILIAIPDGYSAKHVVLLGKQILANPRIQRLLERASPLALSSSSCSNSSGSSSSGKRRRKKKSKKYNLNGLNQLPKRESVRVMEVLLEESHDDASPQKPKPSNDEITSLNDHSAIVCDEILKRAVQNAEEANLQVPSPPLDGRGRQRKSRISAGSNRQNTDIESFLLERYPSFRRRLTQPAVESDDDSCLSLSNKSQDPIDAVGLENDKSSSLSFASISSSNVNITRRQKQRARVLQKMSAICAIILVFMIFRYFIDPLGYASRGKTAKRTPHCAMGISGLIRFALLFLLLLKSQLFLRRWKKHNSKLFERGDLMGRENCPFMHTMSLLLYWES